MLQEKNNLMDQVFPVHYAWFDTFLKILKKLSFDNIKYKEIKFYEE